MSLETGTMAEFAPARALYESAGFSACDPFADYQPSDDNCFMTLLLDDAAAPKVVVRGVGARRGRARRASRGGGDALGLFGLFGG